MGKVLREGEEEVVGRVLEREGVAIRGRVEIGIVEGGDMLWLNENHLIVGIGGHTEIRYRHNQLCLEFAWSRKPFLKHLEKRLKKRFSEI